MTIQGNEFDQIISQVLTDNTAQSVLNHLTTLESNRARVRTRWIWELLQNARDTSANSDAELVASIKQSDDEVVFRHNGGSFEREEIIHLIYHGSTKVDSPEALGRYGSGFLTTHLLSPEIGVSGQLEDGRGFSFRLKREVGSVGDLSRSMQDAASAFVDSLSNEPRTGSYYTTEFRYPLRGDASEVVAEGIATLKRSAPLVVVFNREFSSISIESSGDTMEFKVSGRKRLKQTQFELTTVAETKNGSSIAREYLVAQGEKSSVAIPVGSVAGRRVVLPIVHTPRLFLGFPLVGTENFSFPAVINSFRFTATEHRDGVFLWQAEDASDAANQENQAVIEEACELLTGMLQFVACSGWRNAYLLADVPKIQVQTWLNVDRLRERLAELLIERIRETPAVLNESGEAIPPQEAELPLANTQEGVVNFWDLLVGWQEEQDIWPRRDEAFGWCNAIRSWAMLKDCEVSSFDEGLDGRRLASIVDSESWDRTVDTGTHRVRLLKSRLKEGISAIEWLDRLIGFLRNEGLGDVVSEYRIVPSQRALLRVLPRLHRDAGISDELKNVAEILGWRIRLWLRDSRIASVSEEPGRGDWDNEYVVGELTRRIRERADEDPNDDFRKASTELFTWMVQQENWEALRGFPAFSRMADPDHPTTVVYLPSNDQDVEPPLAPVGAWPEDLRPFADLFPPNRILADDFLNAFPNADDWRLLVERSLVMTDILIPRSVNFNRFYPERLLADEVEHRTVKEVDVTDVWRQAETIARVRDSQERAGLFWRFLTEYLVPRDIQSLEDRTAECECGEPHRYFPAAWIERVRENSWVRLANDRRDRPNARSLAILIKASGWTPGSLGKDSAVDKLLEAIDVSRFDFTLESVAENDASRAAVDNAFIDILVTIGGNVDNLAHVPRYLEDLKNDEALPEVLNERRERRRQVQENQHLGSQVEKLVKQSLEGEGFTVCRTGIGSDFAIEFNDITRLELAKSDRTWLVEVKATRDNRVRMSDKQAVTSVDEGDGFLLCVVPVQGEVADLDANTVRDSMLFVANIGPRLDEFCNNLNVLNELRETITTGESEGIQLEVDSGNARIRVANSVWENDGFRLEDLPYRLQ